MKEGQGVKLTKQVSDQCRAIAHMARALADVHDAKALMVSQSRPEMIEFVGRNTAELMETLGNILNGMDAVDESEDGWMDPIFAEAHRLWPQAPAALEQPQ